MTGIVDRVYGYGLKTYQAIKNLSENAVEWYRTNPANMVFRVFFADKTILVMRILFLSILMEFYEESIHADHPSSNVSGDLKCARMCRLPPDLITS